MAPETRSTESGRNPPRGAEPKGSIKTQGDGCDSRREIIAGVKGWRSAACPKARNRFGLSSARILAALLRITRPVLRTSSGFVPGALRSLGFTAARSDEKSPPRVGRSRNGASPVTCFAWDRRRRDVDRRTDRQTRRERAVAALVVRSAEGAKDDPAAGRSRRLKRPTRRGAWAQSRGPRRDLIGGKSLIIRMKLDSA